MSEFIPYGRQDISAADIESVIQVLRSAFLTQGPAVEQFEASLGRFLNARNVVAVSNGTTGLHIAYLAAGVGPGDAVIVPAMTFAATSNAVLYCGATPVFADVDLETGLICPDSVRRCLEMAKKAGLKPKVLAPVHYAGRPCDMLPLLKIASEHNLIFVEDACHAFGAEYREVTDGPLRKVGAADFASMAVFSFHPVKHITTGEGGAVTTSDPRLAQKLRLLRTHGITKNHNDFKNESRAREKDDLNPWYHEMVELGFNYRMCDIQAALGTSQVTRGVELVRRRREIADRYTKSFAGLRGIRPAAGDGPGVKHSYHLYPLRVDFASIGLTRAQVMAKLKKSSVGSQVHYIPVPWHPYYENNRNLWLSDQLTNAAKFYQAELSIPMFAAMTDDEVARVIQAVQTLA